MLGKYKCSISTLSLVSCYPSQNKPSPGTQKATGSEATLAGVAGLGQQLVAQTRCYPTRDFRLVRAVCVSVATFRSRLTPQALSPEKSAFCEKLASKPPRVSRKGFARLTGVCIASMAPAPSTRIIIHRNLPPSTAVEVFFVLLGPVFYWVRFSAKLPTSPASPASLGPGVAYWL